MPQGSFLRLLLFNLFIDDLELKISSVVTKFVDNTKFFPVGEFQTDCEDIQEDLWVVK